jgi:O-antigen/teichoic acid export membrane protein
MGTSRATLELLIGRTAGFIAGFGIPMVLVRALDQHEFGIYKYLFLLASTLNVLQFGMAESLYYFVARRPPEAGKPIANAVAMLGVIGGMVAVVMTVGREPVARWAGSAAIAPYVPLLSVFLALTLVAMPLEIVMISRRQYRPAAVVYAASDAARALLFMVPGALTHSLRALLWGAVAYGLLRVVTLGAYLVSQFGASLRLDRVVWIAQLRYALPFSAAVFIEVAQLNLHQFVVWGRFDPATFAIYAAGCLQVPLVDLLTTSVSNVLMVRMTEDADVKPEALRLWYDAITRLAFVLWPLVVALMLTARDLIVFLFTPAYLASVPIFTISSLAIGLAVFPVDSVLRVYARTSFLIVMNLIRLSVVAAGIVWAMSAFHLKGAIGITVVSMAIAKAVAIWRVAGVLEVPLRRALPWRALAGTAAIAIAAAAPAWWIAGALTGLPALLHGGLVASIYAVIYLAIDFVCRPRGRHWQALPIRVLR